MLPHNYKIKTQPDLFIAWDKDLGKFADPKEYISFCSLAENPWEEGKIHIQALGRYIKLNYAGINDKRGRKIFESYIVCAKYKLLGKSYKIVGVVEFERSGFVITDTSGTTSTLSAFDPEDLEILGNIFQNRDLLKE